MSTMIATATSVCGSSSSWNAQKLAHPYLFMFNWGLVIEIQIRDKAVISSSRSSPAHCFTMPYLQDLKEREIEKSFSKTEEVLKPSFKVSPLKFHNIIHISY